MEEIKQIAKKIYDHQIKQGWENVSIKDCLERANDYYIIHKIVK